MQRLRSTIVIPARLASTRLPRKLLLAETGKPLIQHTYEAASRANRAQGILVAADCDEIAAAVRSFGGQVELTSPDCQSGTDRVAEVAKSLRGVTHIFNVQGDEPLVDPTLVTRLAKAMLASERKPPLRDWMLATHRVFALGLTADHNASTIPRAPSSRVTLPTSESSHRAGGAARRVARPKRRSS